VHVRAVVVVVRVVVLVVVLVGVVHHRRLCRSINRATSGGAVTSVLAREDTVVVVVVRTARVCNRRGLRVRVSVHVRAVVVVVGVVVLMVVLVGVVHHWWRLCGGVNSTASGSTVTGVLARDKAPVVIIVRTTLVSYRRGLRVRVSVHVRAVVVVVGVVVLMVVLVRVVDHRRRLRRSVDSTAGGGAITSVLTSHKRLYELTTAEGGRSECRTGEKGSGDNGGSEFDHIDLFKERVK
jgi:hypothetical protein